MQFSSNVPHGPRAVREDIDHRADIRLTMNVSGEADAAYIAEKGLKLGPTILKSWPVGLCARCSGAVRNAPFLNDTEGSFCSRECRDAGKVPATPHNAGNRHLLRNPEKRICSPLKTRDLQKRF